jgi:hypothetical protein
MRNSKLRLNVEELSVESFSPADEVSGRGTVRGADATLGDQSGCINCVPSYDMAVSCDWTQCLNNISCVNPGGCSGGGTYAQITCAVNCHTTPPIE